MGCGASTASQQPTDAAPLLSQPLPVDGKGAARIVADVSADDTPHADSSDGDGAAEQSAASPDSATTSTAAAASTASAATDSHTPPKSFSAPKPGHRHTLSHTEDRFVILKVLGEGASCKVVSVRDRRSGCHYAMKIMDKSEPYNGVLFENEALILRTLQHPNILQYVESYEDKNTYHLLTVLCQGGELFDRVKNGSFSEQSAAQLAKQMLQALSYCHNHSIVHRDLKVEPSRQSSIAASTVQQHSSISQLTPARLPRLPHLTLSLSVCAVSLRTSCLPARPSRARCS